MADQKISQLTPLTTTPTMNDQFIINHDENGLETRSITFEKLVEASGGVAPTQYFDFDGGQEEDVSTFWGSSKNGGNAITLTPKSKQFDVPANTVGAYVFYSSRMDSRPSSGVVNAPWYGTTIVPAHKLYTTCVQTIPGASWATTADGSGNESDGFGLRMITSVSVGGYNNESDVYGTYHASKWNYVSWTPSDTDREFTYSVQWSIIRTGFQKVLLGMNRVIIIPVYKNVNANRTAPSVDPGVDLRNGVLPTQFNLRDSAHLSEFYTDLDNLAQQQKDQEVLDRTHDYSEMVDKILRNITVYKQRFPGETDNIVLLDAILDQVYASAALTDLSAAETTISGLYEETRDIVGVDLGWLSVGKGIL